MILTTSRFYFLNETVNKKPKKLTKLKCVQKLALSKLRDIIFPTRRNKHDLQV